MDRKEGAGRGRGPQKGGATGRGTQGYGGTRGKKRGDFTNGYDRMPG